MDAHTKMSNQDRLEKIRVELFEIANSYSIAGCGYLAIALRGISDTIRGILTCLADGKVKK